MRGLKIAEMETGTGIAACAYLYPNTVSQTREARQWMQVESDDLGLVCQRQVIQSLEALKSGDLQC